MKAFISSTSLDLAEYRQAASEVCIRLYIVPIGMEQFESMGMGATAGSTHKLDDADVYVGIVANRYGYIEDGHDRSVTELEFEHAGARGIERLCFVADPAAPLAVYPEHQDKLAAFKARIGTLVRSTFASSWELKYKLYDSLVKWKFRRGAGVEWRHVFAPLFADYARFGGRADVLDDVERFVAVPDAGYLVITAPAGYGKTALAVKLVELHSEITAYHFFTTLYAGARGELLSEEFFLRNVVEQIRLWSFSPHDSWQTPTTLSGWVAAYQQLFATPLRDKRILVIDGLDEVTAWKLRPYLNGVPPANLKVIVTVRDVGQNWADEYGFPKAFTRHLMLGGLTRDDVRDVLTLSGPVAAAFAADDALLDKVIGVTSPPGTAAGADPLYVTCLADDIESRRVTAANIGDQPQRLEEYLKDWWGAIVAEAGTDSAALDVLGTLAAALGPIRGADLVALHPSLEPTLSGDPLARVCRTMRRTLGGTDATGYAFAHPRFRDYVRRYPEVKAYEAKLVDYCRAWRTHRGRYALTHAVQHLAAAGAHDELFALVLDEDFQRTQKDTLGSLQPVRSDLQRAIEIACEEGDFVRVLRCVVRYRGLVKTEGVASGVFKDVREGRFDAAARVVTAYGGGVKTSGTWVLALRCYVVWAAVQAGDAAAAVRCVNVFGRQLGLRYHGATVHTSDLCDALIAQAVIREPALAAEIGVDRAWAPAVAGYLTSPRVDAEAVVARLEDLKNRITTLETMTGENPSLVEFIDEERTGDYTVRLRDALVAVAHDAAGQAMIDRALAVVENNPYPRYRDNALVAVGVAVLAAAQPGWIGSRIESILVTGLEKEGVTFTFDLAAQLAAEAARRGWPTGELEDYLADVLNSHDRWGTRLRGLSARAAAEFAQGRTPAAVATLTDAASWDDGFAGYSSAHLLSVVSRWCELGEPAQLDARAVIQRSRSHAGRVRDPKFAVERQALVDRFEAWLSATTPEWPEVSAVLRTTPEDDIRRAWKDLVSARWAAVGQWKDWPQLIIAALNDATAIDDVLGRLAARAIREHRAGVRELSDTGLTESIRLCMEGVATSRPWQLAAPAYG